MALGTFCSSVQDNTIELVFINLFSVSHSDWSRLSQIRYSLVVILELNGVSEVQYKDVMMIDNGKYQ